MLVLPAIANYLKKREKPYELIGPYNEVRGMYSLKVLALINDLHWKQRSKELDIRVHSMNFTKDREDFLSYIRIKVIDKLEKDRKISSDINIEKIKRKDWVYLEPIILWRKWPLKIWTSEINDLNEFNITCEFMVKDKEWKLVIGHCYDVYCVNPRISEKWKHIIFMDDIETKVVDR